MSGQSKGAPHISVSPRMTRIIVSGIDTTDDTKMNYVAKRVDWMARIVRDISLTSAITGAVN